ncbi:hypothetical protein D4R75_09635 [bacterium]|nr:MAG: hypothetical protein D4R75_09635 [bacterium]
MHDKKSIGLALSGGGVRAAAFHLGVLEKLFELGMLDRIDVISTVSGGSIVGAFFCSHRENFQKFKDLMIANLQKSIELRVILNPKICFAFVNPYYSRSDITADVYDKLYFSGRKLADVPSTPKLIINATNLATGKNWKFSQEYMGDWKIGYGGNPKNFALSRAVAASTAVPGLLHPIRVRVKDHFDNPGFPIKRIGLCDGGLYDNQGIHALTSNYDRNELCEYIICSDASFPFEDTPHKISLRLFNVLRRQNDIMMARIKNLQFQDLIYGKLRGVVTSAFFSINWSIDNLLKSFVAQEELSRSLDIWAYISTFKGRDYRGITDQEFSVAKDKIQSALNYPEFRRYLGEEDVGTISKIGTRLFSLSKEQIDLLSLHGATLCGFQVRTHFKELLSSIKIPS